MPTGDGMCCGDRTPDVLRTPITPAAAAPSACNRREGGVPLAKKVRFLSRPSSYPDRPRRVTTVETHMSWVFLTDQQAYKLKKPVRHPFLNFGTVEARRRNCRAELRLNRRLAPEVYLSVLPLTADPDGRLRLSGQGRVVDWVVKMRRLPQERTLEHAIKHREVRAADLRRVAALLAKFYCAAAPVEIKGATYRHRFEVNVRANRRELAKPDWRLPAELVRSITAAQRTFLRRQARLLEDRARDRRIVEGHGDLRPEHVYLGDQPVITDCLEFNRTFRILDPADELAFLALECERLGAPEVDRGLFETYSQITGDHPSEILVNFYKTDRACLRAKLAIWHLKEPDVRQRSKWRRRAIEYLGLAARYAAALSRRGVRPPSNEEAIDLSAGAKL